MKESANIFKQIEKERANFPYYRIEMFGERLSPEEGLRLSYMDIPRECRMRRRIHVMAAWLYEKCTRSFDEVKEILDDDKNGRT